MRILCVALLVLAGCGPDLSGTYSGTVSQTTACADGSGGEQNFSVTWVISGSSIQTGGTCDPWTLKGESIQPRDCGSSRLTGGNVSPNGNGIRVSAQLASAACTSTFVGDLARQ